MLSYDLFGASSSSEVSKSINTSTSIGGYFIEDSQTWTRVEEYVSAHNLKKGKNIVLFTSEGNTRYLVRNLQIEKRLESEDSNRIRLNTIVRDSLSGKSYISGIVPSSQGVELFISGEPIAITNNNFEYVSQIDKNSLEPLSIELRKNNILIDKQIISSSDSKNAKSKNDLSIAFDKHFFNVDSNSENTIYTVENLAIEIPKESYSNDFTLSIQKLRPSDYAPTGMSMINVTQDNSAYRFLPDGIKFDEPVRITIPYNVKAIPSGYSPKDIQVFYFDTEVKQWTKVKVIAILEDTNQVVALTNHFTDYLAGVIQEPESPETSSFMPTSISGIQVTNPTENTPMVSVPQINDRGDAVLNFPLMLPPARQGMVPNLSVNYNSSADEGDFGLGWSLSAPETIEIDTRWGVPLYDPNKETESYLLNGEELLLVTDNGQMYAPHKDALIYRSFNAQFQKHIHDPSLLIIREDQFAGNYTYYSWKIEDTKTGWTYLYNPPNIYNSNGKWYLTEIYDAFGNKIKYFFNTENTFKIHLEKIVYNIYEGDGDLSNLSSDIGLGTIIVEIQRKNTLDFPQKPRADVKVSTRSGNLEYSKDLIDQIIVRTERNLNDKQRCAFIEYKFQYKEGKFGRTLLNKIILSSYNNGNEFVQNCIEINQITPIIQEYNFDYYDDIGSGSLFESSGKSIMTYKDYETDYDRYKVYISALGGGEGSSNSYTVGASFGAVTPIFPASWLPFSRAATLGGNFGGGNSNVETKVMMYDIDGDGLPDKVFKGGKDFYYRKNQGDKFSTDVFPIKNLPNLSYSKSENSDDGFNVSVFLGSYTKSKSKSKTTTTTYMADVNADGLMDVVDNERVYFGYIDPQTKQPKYSLDSSVTPVIVLKEDDVAPVLNPIPQVSLTNSPMDVVMVWRAPKAGQVSVTGIITKEHISLQSGVKFSIEKLHETDMGPAQFIYGPQLMLSSDITHSDLVYVVKGDLLLFRTHTNQVPLQELGITWNPKVEYTTPNLDPFLTSSRHSSSYKESFIIGMNQEEIFKKGGKFRLEWPSFSVYDQDRITIRVSYFKKNSTTGGNLPILGNNIVIYEKTSGILENYTFSSPNSTLDNYSVTSNPMSFHYLKVEVLSDSEIDWKTIDTKFKPKLVSLDNNNDDVYLTPYYSNYSKVKIYNNPLLGKASGPNATVEINNNFSIPQCNQSLCENRYVYLVAKHSSGSIIKLVSSSTGAPAGYVKFRYKFDANGNIVQKQRLNENYIYVNESSTYSFTTTPYNGQKYYFEYYTTEHGIAEKLHLLQENTSTSLIKVSSSQPVSNFYNGVDNNGKLKASIYSSEATPSWGSMYRNWGQFLYKGVDVGATYLPIVGQHINPNNLNLVTNTGQSADDILNDQNISVDDLANNIDEIEKLGGNVSEYFGMTLPNKKLKRWESHEHLYISESTISPYTRFLTDDIPDLMPPVVPVNNFGAYGIRKYSFFDSSNDNKSVGFLGVSLGRATTKGSGRMLNEFMDINGDGFPDIIGDRVQLTAKRGGLSNRIVTANLNIKTTINGSGNLAGGSMAIIQGTPKTDTKNNPSMNLIVGNNASASLSGSFFETTNSTNRFYADINGDGLVDIIEDGKVFLNYGGTFLLSTIWSNLPDQKSKTTTRNVSTGGSFSGISNQDISAGLSISSNTSEDIVTYIDINGDGLPEKIINGTTYYINLGTSFESIARTLPGTQKQKSTDGGINGNLTLCYYFPNFFLIGPKFCGNGGASSGSSISSEEARFMDFDGDGFIDYATSTKNESITVYKSRIKRTNLLKIVTQSTGSTISLDYDIVNPIDNSVIGSTYKMPYKKWALTKVAVFDGFVGDGEDTISYAYEYFNGYKDRKERSFLGFGMTKSHLLDKNGWPYTTSVTEYVLNDMTATELYLPGTSSNLKQYIYKKGLPKKTYTLDRENNKLDETLYTYKYYDSSKITGDLNTTQNLASEVVVFTEKLSVLPLITSVKKQVLNYNTDDLTSSLTYETESRFALYDKRGNVKKYLDVDRGLTVDIEYLLAPKVLAISHKVSNTTNNQMLRLTKAISNDGLQIHELRKYTSDNSFIAWNFEYNVLGNLTRKIYPMQNGNM